MLYITPNSNQYAGVAPKCMVPLWHYLETICGSPTDEYFGRKLVWRSPTAVAIGWLALTASTSPADAQAHPAFIPATAAPRPDHLPPFCPEDTRALPDYCSRNVWGIAGSGRLCTPPHQPTSSRCCASAGPRPRRPGSSRDPPLGLPPTDLRQGSVGCQLSRRVWRRRCFHPELNVQTTRCTSKAGAGEHVYSPPSSQSQPVRCCCCCFQGLPENRDWAVKLRTDSPRPNQLQPGAKETRE